MQTAGYFYDGKRSKRHSVTLRLQADQLEIAGSGLEKNLAVERGQDFSPARFDETFSLSARRKQM